MSLVCVDLVTHTDRVLDFDLGLIELLPQMEVIRPKVSRQGHIVGPTVADLSTLAGDSGSDDVDTGEPDGLVGPLIGGSVM